MSESFVDVVADESRKFGGVGVYLLFYLSEQSEASLQLERKLVDDLKEGEGKGRDGRSARAPSLPSNEDTIKLTLVEIFPEPNPYRILRILLVLLRLLLFYVLFFLVPLLTSFFLLLLPSHPSVLTDALPLVMTRLTPSWSRRRFTLRARPLLDWRPRSRRSSVSFGSVGERNVSRVVHSLETSCRALVLEDVVGWRTSLSPASWRHYV